MYIATYLHTIVSKTKERDALLSKMYSVITEVGADHVIVTGSSGLIAAAALNERYGVPFVFIRKDKSSHSPNKVEGYSTDYKKGIILDDLVATGKTFLRILRAYKKDFNEVNECNGGGLTLSVCNFTICYLEYGFQKLNLSKSNKALFRIGLSDYVPKNNKKFVLYKENHLKYIDIQELQIKN